MPTHHDPKLPLRLALSHCEKADAAIRQCDRSLAEGGVDREHHANLRKGYEHERKLALRTIERLMGVERARLESLEAQRRSALEEQLHLPERVAAGKLEARAANDANRKLTQRLAELDSQLAITRSRLEAKTAEQLGGFIDLPFAEYLQAESATLDTLRATGQESNRRSRDWYVALLIAAVAGGAVFLPWFGHGDTAATLASTGNDVAHLARQAALPIGISRYAWLAYALIPFLGILISGGRNARVMGWGLLGLGLAMLAGGVYPGLMLGVRTSEHATLMGLAAAFRPGAALYCLCAGAFVVLGALRVSPPGDNLKHAVSVSFSLLGAVAAIGLLAAVAMLGVQNAPQASFTASIDGVAEDRIAFAVRNEGRVPIACYLPYREQLPAGETTLPAFGLRLDVKEKGVQDFHKSPQAPFVWRLVNAPVPADGAATVSPGLELKGYLDLRQLPALGVEASALRVTLLGNDGKEIGYQDFELKDRYLSAPGVSREPLRVAPPATRIEPNEQKKAAPKPAAAEAPAVPAPPQPSLRVEYTGSIGGRAVVRLYGEDGSIANEGAIGVGDALGGGWTLDAIVRQPSSIILKHTTSGETAQVVRGNVVDVAQPAAAQPETRPAAKN